MVPRDQQEREAAEAGITVNTSPGSWREDSFEQRKTHARQDLRELTTQPPSRILEEPGDDDNYEFNPKDWEIENLASTLDSYRDARDFTNRMAMKFTYWIYRDDHINAEGTTPQGIQYDDLKEPHERIPKGFVPILHMDKQKESSYYGIALYHAASGTVLIVNRGTQLSEFSSHFSQFRRDVAAITAYRESKVAKQAEDAKQFLSDVVRQVKLKSPELLKARWISTGHSLGGAATQVQVAFSRKGQILDAPPILGVTFAGLGARKTIQAMGLDVRDSFDPQVDSAIVDYTRIGDGAVLRKSFLIDPDHPARVGLSFVLNGVRMEELRDAERRLDGYVAMARRPGHQFVGPALPPLSPEPMLIAELSDLYYQNHTVTNYAHPTLDDSVYKTLNTARP